MTPDVGSAKQDRSAGRALSRCHSIADLRDLCRRRLPRPIFDFVDGGAEDEWTLWHNTHAFGDYALMPHALVDVRSISTQVRVLGQPLSVPLLLAPTGGAGLVHPKAEIAIARAAARSGVYFSLSNFAGTRMEDIGPVCPGPKLFQLYPTTDHALTLGIIRRARSAGFSALCVTVDSVVEGNRERDLHNGLMVSRSRILSPQMLWGGLAHPCWTVGVMRSWPDSYINFNDDRAFDAAQRKAKGQSLHQSLTWDDIRAYADEWDGPFAVKGILRPQDARLAADAGATAVIVSNHGGRQLDGAIPAVKALPGIAKAVGGQLEIILDGGIRRGAHLVKALALGADACMVGRPHLYGLAAAGEAGVTASIHILKTETERCMKLLGCTDTCSLDQKYLSRA